jgi:hypothetical protein
MTLMMMIMYTVYIPVPDPMAPRKSASTVNRPKGHMEWR